MRALGKLHVLHRMQNMSLLSWGRLAAAGLDKDRRQATPLPPRPAFNARGQLYWEGEEEEASNVPLPDSPLLLPLPEQSLTPTSLVDPLATEPVECRGFEGGEAEADVDEGEELGVDGGVGVVDVEDEEDEGGECE